MCSDWPQVSLREFVDLLAGFAFKSSGYTEELGDIRLLRGDNIAPGKVRWDGVKRWSRDTLAELSKYSLEAGDVVLAMDRPWIPAGLKVAQVNTADTPSYLVQRVARLRTSSVEDRGFLFALLSTPNFESYIQSATTGTAVPHISAKQILDFPFRLPPAHVRAQVGALTSALDDRITLLRETNATLEAIAQALFKSWFVDFDPVRAKAEGRQPEGMDATTAALFPDSFEESELGLVPKGWGVTACKNIMDVRDGTHDSPKPSSSGYPLITSRHITSGEIITDDAYLIAAGDYLSISKRSKVDRLDVLITMIGTVGVPAIVLDDAPEFAIKNIGLFKSSEYPLLSHYMYILLCSAGMQRYLLARLAGTTQKYLSLKALREISVLVPSTSVLEEFSRVVRPLFEKIHQQRGQIKCLTQLRDTLLPRLISGQLRMPETETLLEGSL